MPAHAISVLIADDDDDLRRALARFIESEPALELSAAVADAEQAIARAFCDRPAVALVDVGMPGGGAEATRGIKLRSPQTRVLALSGSNERALVLEMLLAGADGYLVKTDTPDAILNAIVRAAAGQGTLSPEVTTDVITELADQLNAGRENQEQIRTRESRMERAFAKNALGMEFQPICTLAGETVGAEALARFECLPHRTPDRWFAEAREAGVLLELEMAAVRAALRALPAIPRPVYLAINVSPLTLASSELCELLERSDGYRIVMEVTEHIPVDNYEELGEALAALRAMGVRVAVDDAGAGFSSLRHILRLAPEFIKLDRSLIHRIEADNSRQALAAGLISFAQRIDATIIAEGVERAAEVEVLRDLGVLFGQGYFFARPAPLPVSLRNEPCADIEAGGHHAAA